MASYPPLVLGSDGIYQQLQAGDAMAETIYMPPWIAATTFGSLPAANTVTAGTKVFVTNVGLAGSEWFSDGAIWKPTGGRVVLAGSAVAIPLTNVTVETVMLTVTVPGGIMGSNGSLDIYHLWSAGANNANAKVVGIRISNISGTTFGAATLTSLLSDASKTSIRNRNLANSQMGGSLSGGFGASASTLPVSAVDTSSAFNIVFTGKPNVSTDTVTLESYLIELIIP